MATERKVIGTDANGDPIYEDETNPWGTRGSGPVNTSVEDVPLSDTLRRPGEAVLTGGASEAARAGGASGSDVDNAVKAAATGGIYGSGKEADVAGLLSGYSGAKWAANQLGFGPGSSGGDGSSLTSAYDAQKYLDTAQGQSGGVYQQAMDAAGRAAGGPTLGQPITAQNVSASQVHASPLVTGQPAQDLRAQQLQQAATAANSPSAAAAQMRAAGQQISQQQLGQAAMARGADRAAAKRDAMLATGTQGMVAANQTAALAAQEQAAKQGAYTQALAGVRAGDVSMGSADVQAQLANQQAALAAQEANQRAGLTAQQAEAGNKIAAYEAGAKAGQGYLQTASGATNVGTGAAKVAADYETQQNVARAAEKAAKYGAGATIAAGAIKAVSDERVKDDIGEVGGVDSPYLSRSPYLHDVTDEDLYNQTPIWQGGHADIWHGGDAENNELEATSDERAKRAVERATPADAQAWAHSVHPITFRYRDGVEDDGRDVHLGVSAQEMERSGPYGKLMVHRDPETNLRKVDYGAAALMLSKAALERADEALAAIRRGRR